MSQSNPELVGLHLNIHLIWFRATLGGVKQRDHSSVSAALILECPAEATQPELPGLT